MVLFERETWNILQLAVGMCFVFFAFCSQGFIAETVLSNRHKEDPSISEHAGYYSQTIIYGAFIFSTIISPPVVKFLTPKWSLVFGSSAYTLYMIGYEYINIYYLYISAAYEGLCAGALWTAMGHYLAINSNEETIGRNSSVVWLIYSSSYIFGGIFLFIMFGDSPDTSISMATTRILYGVFSAVCFCGNICFALLPQSESTAQKAKMEMKAVDTSVTTPGGTFSIPPKGSATFEIVDKDGATGEEEESYWMELLKTWRLLWTTDMLLLSFICAYSGMELSFWSSVYSTALSFTKRFPMNTNRLMALNSIAVGVGEIIAGVIFGVFGSRSNRFGRYPIVILGTVVALISYALTFINLPGRSSFEETNDKAFIDPSIAIALTVGVMLGFTDACVNTQIYSLLSVRYEGETTQANALNKMFHAILSTVCMFYGSVLELEWQLLILSIGAVLSTVTFTMAELRYKRSCQNKDT